ncbi:MAG TPA: polyketide cyclase [Blastocatellia bacterium]|nr:polyketide cyclase [Blastocatellia bacterium]
MLKKILVGLVAVVLIVVAAFTVLIFSVDDSFSVEREVTINRPRAEVFAYLRLIKNQSVWGPWFKKEPTMKQEFRGTDGEVGFVAYWNGTTDDVGEGEQEITRIVDGERVETQLRFIRPFTSKADAYLVTEDAGEGNTKVRWGFTSSMPRPMNLLLLFMDMDKEIGKDYEEGLANLKLILENQ